MMLWFSTQVSSVDMRSDTPLVFPGMLSSYIPARLDESANRVPGEFCKLDAGSGKDLRDRENCPLCDPVTNF
jgi:hypothetical protein